MAIYKKMISNKLLVLVGIFGCAIMMEPSFVAAFTSHQAFHRSAVAQKLETNSLEFRPRRPPSALNVLPPFEPSSSIHLSREVITSPEPIHSLFSVATFLPQPFWFLIILIPNAEITKKIMGDMKVVTLCCLVHLAIVVFSIAEQGSGVTAPLASFNDVFDPAGDPQKAFIGMLTEYPNFPAEEWSHVLTWDLFVGRWIWLDGLERGIFTAHSVLFTNLIGPPGLLLHWLTCIVLGKGVVGNQAAEQSVSEDS